MARVKSRDTKPELKVRKALHAAGLRFRLQASDLPGRPDIVFRSRKIAIFVHGCFWHRHDDPTCPLTRTPKSRVEFWEAKFETNAARDAKNSAALLAKGWAVLTIWECQLSKPAYLDELVAAVRAPVGT